MSLISNLLNRAAEIRDASQEGENSAQRVGGFLVSLVQAIDAALPAKTVDASIVDTSATSDGFVITLHTKDSDGTTGTKTISIPAATESAPGVMTAADKAAIARILADVAQLKGKVGAAGGIAPLGSDGKVPAANLPELPQQKECVVEFGGMVSGVRVETTGLALPSANDTSRVVYDSDTNRFLLEIRRAGAMLAKYYAAWPEGGTYTLESGKVYIDTATDKTYRWDGETLVLIGSSLTLGESADTAYPGNKGKANAEAIEGIVERIGAPDGIASLNAKGEVPIQNLPGWEQVYGVEWDTENPSPNLTRIGNMELHRTLPIQSKMRRCLLLDDGTVNYYLDADDSTKKEDGTDADLTGADGQYMVELPDMYVRFEQEGTKCRALMSEHPIYGFKLWPRCYVSAVEATVQRSTSKLSSVCNTTDDYRGGNNNATWDDTYRDQRGIPASYMSLDGSRRLARERGERWNCYTYDIHKKLFWLFACEYATFNSQADFNAALTEEGYRQGGLGAGVSNLKTTKWMGFNSCSAVIPCGYTNGLGNATGVVDFTMPAEYDATPLTTHVPSYRGIENPFGHLWKVTDGLLANIESNGGSARSKMYICSVPEKFASTITEDYEYCTDIPREGGYVKDIAFGKSGDIIAANIGASATTYFCDNYYTSIPASGNATRCVCFGGSADLGVFDGLLFEYTNYGSAQSFNNIGTRLCYIANGHIEDELKELKERVAELEAQVEAEDWERVDGLRGMYLADDADVMVVKMRAGSPDIMGQKVSKTHDQWLTLTGIRNNGPGNNGWQRDDILDVAWAPRYTTTGSAANRSYLSGLPSVRSIKCTEGWMCTSSNVSFGFVGNSCLEEVYAADMFASISGVFCAFQNCTSLKRVHGIGTWQTGGVTSLASCFFGCGSLEELDLSGWDVGKVTSLQNTFRNCTALRVLNVDGWNISKVTNINCAFFGCSHLTELDLSGWDVRLLTNVGNAFASCSRLESLDLTGWDLRSLTDNPTTQNSIFNYCHALRYIRLSASYFTQKVPVVLPALGVYGDGNSNGWLEMLAQTAPTIRLAPGWDQEAWDADKLETDEATPKLLTQEDGVWYLNDGIGRTIQLHANLKNMSWAQPLIAQLQAKGYTIA